MDEYYNRYWKKAEKGGSFNDQPSWDKENFMWHLDFFKKYIGKSVLDIGSGDGTFLNYIIKNNPNIKNSIGIDISKEAVDIANKKYCHLKFQQSSIEKLKFKDNSFDTVFAIEVLEHLLDIDKNLCEINRVLEKDGVLCVTTTDFNLLKKIVLAFFWDKFFYPNTPHIRFFTKKTLKSICKKNGFKLIGYKWNKGYFGLMPRGQMAVFKKVKNIKSKNE